MRTQKIAVLNLDDSPFSGQLIDNLKTANFQAEMLKERDKQKAIDETRASDTNLLLVIPEGFGNRWKRRKSRKSRPTPTSAPSRSSAAEVR